ncbi:MAG: hypothetical protein JJ863_06840 [Deltaproteobacteria bacterium]|nr:hypothetical protein [Deltaproteobacteria bacterium]
MNDERDPVSQDGPEYGYEPPAVVESAYFETVARACQYGPPPQDLNPGCLLDNTQ